MHDHTQREREPPPSEAHNQQAKSASHQSTEQALAINTPLGFALAAACYV
jgi:hypothetical protein